GASGKRQALPHARIMIHQMMGGFSGQAEDIDIQAKEIIRMTDIVNEVLALHTGRKIKQIAEDTQRDFYFSSQDAKEYGIIDEVMQNRKLKAVNNDTDFLNMIYSYKKPANLNDAQCKVGLHHRQAQTLGYLLDA
ncbi:MAG: ATP-dependent Clp protease proteolytic subunit, partial [Candidatus Latescibacteria bacterium]|nr:ATP-dependent Clp protease proteolytic subunit [Candidatus Latescibacterota bacterium]